MYPLTNTWLPVQPSWIRLGQKNSTIHFPRLRPKVPWLASLPMRIPFSEVTAESPLAGVPLNENDHHVKRRSLHFRSRCGATGVPQGKGAIPLGGFHGKSPDATAMKITP